MSGDLKIRRFTLQHPQTQRNLILVDTPGFDHFEASDDEVLGILCEWIRTE